MRNAPALQARHRRIRRSALLPNDMMIVVFLGAADAVLTVVLCLADGPVAGGIALVGGGLYVGFLWWHARQR